MSGGIYRSETLNYYRVIMTKESDWLTVNGFFNSIFNHIF